jgi:hypothetical protein
VVGVFPNDQALLRLAGSLLIEQNDEWLVSRRYLSEASMAELTATEPTTGKELQVAYATPTTLSCATNLRHATGDSPRIISGSRFHPHCEAVGDAVQQLSADR